MYSLLFNCNKERTFVTIHLLCSPDYNEPFVELFKSLVIKFPQNTEIILVIVKMRDILKLHIIDCLLHYLLIQIE